MGVYVKDMEMPKNCFDCMFHWHGDGTTYCLAQSKMHDLHHIKWECKGYEEQMKYREPTCPLVPVPPHGRLIDADALIADIKRQCREVFRVDAVSPDDFWITRNEAYNERLWETWCESFFGYLQTRPTIIPASEEDE